MIKLDKLKRLIEIGCVPSDSPEERLRKSIMTIMVIPYSLAGIIWGLYFMRNGFAISGVIPLAYAVVSTTSFLYFIYTKRYNIFRFFQVFLVLVLPFFLQLTLGGFSQSSGMLLWSCTAPFIALVFYDVKTARKWFVALFFTLVLACFLDELARSYFSEDIDESSIVYVYGANFILISFLLFGIQIYFVNGQKKIKIELEEKEELLKASAEIEKQKSLLSVSKGRLELVLGALEEVVWGRNLPDYQMQYVSDSVVKLYGFPVADWYENPNLWTDMIHPDDIQQVEKDNEPLFSVGVTELEYRIITLDKEIKWISSSTRIIKSTDGTPFFMTGIAQDITAQKTAQEQLKQLNHNLAKNQKRLQSVAAEATAVKSAVDTGWSSIEFKPDGTILKANDNFISSLGYSSNEDLIGNHHKIFCEPDYVKSADYKSFWKNLADGKFQAGEFKRIRKDGSKIWINANYTPVKNFDGKVIKVIKISNDISEMVKLRTQSEAIAKELRHFLETANAPIFGIDANGKVNEWNQTSEKITGFKKEEVFGKNLVKTYITEDYQKAVKLVLDNALKGEETANYEFPLFTKEGSRVMVLLNSSTRRNSDGEIVGVLGVGQDITIINEYKENLEKKVKHRTIELEESLEREKELGKLKSSFVSTASHQFRTPLAAIQANSELLSMLARDVEQQNQEKCIKITNRITVEIARMTELMDDVLLLGKSTSGSIDVKPQEINLVDFCQTLAKRFNDIQTDGRIINVATEGEPYNVYLDFKLLSQALSNLLSNAFKFSLGKSNPTLTVSFKPKGFSLIVEDYGIGIPKAEIANLFHPFFRANNATEIKGTGLGLSIAKEYIELNKGILTGKSTEGIGTKFEISFKKYVLREKYGN